MKILIYIINVFDYQEQHTGKGNQNKQLVHHRLLSKPIPEPPGNGQIILQYICIPSAPYLNFSGITIRQPFGNLPVNREKIKLCERVNQPSGYHHISDEIG